MSRDYTIETATNRADDSDIEEQRGFDVGGVDYITKPISIQVLHARIALYLQMKHLSS